MSDITSRYFLTKMYVANGRCQLVDGIEIHILAPTLIYSTPLKSGGVIGKTNHPSQRLFSLLPQGKRYWCIKSDTNILRNRFYPHAIRPLTHRTLLHTTHTVTPTYIQTQNLLTHTHIICTYIYSDSTPTHIQSSYTLLLLCLSYILIPSHLTPLHIYLYRSSIPAHCKYGTGTDPVYSMLTYFLCSSYLLMLYPVCFCSTLLILLH